MTPRKRKASWWENKKKINKNVGLRQTNFTYEVIFDRLKKENIGISLSTVKRNGLRYETEGTVWRK